MSYSFAGNFRQTSVTVSSLTNRGRPGRRGVGESVIHAPFAYNDAAWPNGGGRRDPARPFAQRRTYGVTGNNPVTNPKAAGRYSASMARISARIAVRFRMK